MKSVSVRLILVAMIISLTGMCLVGGVSLVVGGRSVMDSAVNAMINDTKNEATRIDSWMSDQVKYIGAFSTDAAYLPSYESEGLLPLLQKHAGNDPDYFDVYLGFPDGSAVFGSGFVPNYGAGWAATKRPWYIGAMKDISGAFITSPYTDVQTGELCITAAQAVIKDGQPFGVAALDIMITTLTNIVKNVSAAEGGYAFLLDGQGNILVHPSGRYLPDKDDNFPSIKTVENGMFADMYAQATATGKPVVAKDYDGVEKYFTAQRINTTGWVLCSTVPTTTVNAPIVRIVSIVAPIFAAVMFLAGIGLYLMVGSIITRPIRRIAAVAEEIGMGGASSRLTGGFVGEMKLLADAFNTIAESARAQAEATGRLADGYLDAEIPVRSSEDLMGRSLTQLAAKLRGIMGHIHSTSSQVALGSAQIAQSSQSLAQGTTEQAESVEHLSAAIADIAARTAQNAERARMAGEASRKIAQSAETGKLMMENMFSAVVEINDASQSIAQVIQTINGIASQTNILALNASVEAAHAGQHGTGFAVVADEVRVLAGRSAEAASQTDDLISNTVLKTEEGVRIARQTSETLDAIIRDITRTAEMVQEISQFSDDQSAAISQINLGVTQVGQVVQANAGMAQQTAAAVQDLSYQADELKKVLSQFS